MLKISKIRKSFKTPKRGHQAVLDGVSLEFPENSLNFIVGKSGSGKTTLLHVLGGLLKPDGGSLEFDGKEIQLSKTKGREQYRKDNVAFVFQDFNLLTDMTVMENLMIAGLKDEEDVEKMLGLVNLSGFGKEMVSHLSGGEQQRVAIARSLIGNKKILLLDEPTGNLDSKNARLVMETVKALAKSRIVIMVTHDEELAKSSGGNLVRLVDGKVVSQELSSEIGDRENGAPLFEGTVNLPRKLKLKRGIKALTKHPYRTALSSITMAISLALSIFSVSVMAFDYGQACGNALSSLSLHQVEVYYQGEDKDKSSLEHARENGLSLLGGYNARIGKPPLNFNSVTSSGFSVFIVPVEGETFSYNGIEMPRPSMGKVFVPDCLYEMGIHENEMTEMSISLNTSRVNGELEIERVLDSGVSRDLLLKYLTHGYTKLSDEENLIVQGKGIPCYVSKETFLSFFSKDGQEMITGEFMVRSATSVPPMRETYRKVREGDSLLYGSYPSLGNEMALLSGSYALRACLNQLGIETEEEIVGKKVLLNDNVMSGTFGRCNFGAFLPEVVISGIYETTNNVEGIILPQETFEGFVEYQMDYPYYNFANLSVFSDIGQYIEHDFMPPYKSVFVPLRTLKGLAEEGQFILVPVTIVLCAISVVLMFLVFSVNLKERKKEMAMMRAMGLSKWGIGEIFLYSNSFTALLAIVLAFSLSPLLALLVNLGFSPGVLITAFALSWFAFPIALLLAIVLTGLSTGFAILSIGRFDVSTALKKS